ncbi:MULTISPECIES: hypothetical protein [unclassified Facklamia]|uniref:hypothetical protein n=1 Tax=Aerococcaceae TaxID=186827 RepID=UPI0013BA0549|nr:MULTISPECIES: hypothetical protein [unclassified Facklamia]NEW65284.1 hypothetical protein [Facklamia sp. 252]NEW68736.1 hypothetical protein [Facklamia sp. 253]QQD66125.1 hypothetical protein JDW14_03190 [Aerococcaceae bacterium zg-252]
MQQLVIGFIAGAVVGAMVKHRDKERLSLDLKTLPINIDFDKVNRTLSNADIIKSTSLHRVDELECRVTTLEEKLDKTIENIRDMLHLHFSKNAK